MGSIYSLWVVNVYTGYGMMDECVKWVQWQLTLNIFVCTFKLFCCCQADVPRFDTTLAPV